MAATLQDHRFPARPRVGLALGGGGTRATAGIGVLSVFQRAGIPVDCLAGTSIGAVVAATYACNPDVARMVQAAVQFRWRSIVDVSLSGRGLFKGERLESYIAGLVDNKSFAEARVPLAIVAADLNSGEEVVLTEGPLARAARASSSFPGLFAPVPVGDRWLFDGGVVNNVPADAAAALGADVVIAVDTGGSPSRPVITSSPAGFMSRLTAAALPETRLPLIKDVIEKCADIFIDRLTAYRLRVDHPPLLVIRPAVGHVKLEDSRRAEFCIQAGAAAAEEQLPALREFLATLSRSPLPGGEG